MHTAQYNFTYKFQKQAELIYALRAQELTAVINM